MTLDLEDWLGVMFLFFLACVVIGCIAIAIIITRNK